MVQNVAEQADVVVVGAGPAGASAAWELTRLGRQPLLIEQLDRVGGIARTEAINGARFDIGGHRFYTLIEEIEQIWEKILGPEFRKVARLSRIYFRGQFLQYPISLGEVLHKLGLVESLRILGSFMAARLNPRSPELSFEDWVVNRYGRRLFELFFRAYTEKVWGISCRELSADWAAQRIRSMSLLTVLRHALLGSSGARSLISEFRYPRLGVGQMWEAMVQEAVARGAEVRLGHKMEHIWLSDGRVAAVEIAGPDGSYKVSPEHVISSVPLPELVLSMRPDPPDHVLAAARSLRYRAFVAVAVAVEHPNPFPDQWIYVHEPGVKLGRVQNYRNWSPDMVGSPDITLLALEYFCWPNDDFYSLSDEALIKLALQEAETVGLLHQPRLLGARVIRVPWAYPLYDPGYRDHVNVIRRFLEQIENLQTVGRAGLHRYNGMDHSMLTGLLAARNVLGENNDVWAVNEEPQYVEGR
ncbi:MAG: NAD(P)/FAD-dependent oxidoreductase [Armatimonadetes bacterium]|nr:NAD(P)/FAD-dependent oxidoreductase [Armatimonadota bacterium]